jgi:hypothetical protein
MQPGDPFSAFSSGAWNRLMEIARKLTAGDITANEAKARGFDPLPGELVWVKNFSDVNCDRFAVLGINGVVVEPRHSEQAFLNHPVLKCGVPNISHYDGRFVILQDALAAGKVARVGMISGISFVKIDVQKEWHFRADICVYPEKLWSYPGGAAQILWKESGEGVKWAIVRFPVQPYMEFAGVLKDYLSWWNYPVDCDLWWMTEQGWADSGYDVSVYPPITLTGAIPAGKAVTLTWRPYFCLEVTGRQC